MTSKKSVFFSQLYPIIAEEIAKGNSFTFTAYGISMHPYIKNGTDRVVLSPVTKPIQKNDIIFYRRTNGSFVLHRVIKVETAESFTLCGDNQYILEPNISANQVIAVMSHMIRKEKEISTNSATSRIWCFFLPLRRIFLHGCASIKSRIKHGFKRT